MKKKHKLTEHNHSGPSDKHKTRSTENWDYRTRAQTEPSLFAFCDIQPGNG